MNNTSSGLTALVKLLLLGAALLIVGVVAVSLGVGMLHTGLESTAEWNISFSLFVGGVLSALVGFAVILTAITLRIKGDI